jgi:hypothetical protein
MNSRLLKWAGVIAALGFATLLSMSALSVLSDRPSPSNETRQEGPHTQTIIAAANGTAVGSAFTLQAVHTVVNEEGEEKGLSEAANPVTAPPSTFSIPTGFSNLNGYVTSGYNMNGPSLFSDAGTSHNSMPSTNSSHAGGNASSGPNSNFPFNTQSGGSGGSTPGAGEKRPSTNNQHDVIHPDNTPSTDPTKPNSGQAPDDSIPDFGVSDIVGPVPFDPVLEFDDDARTIDPIASDKLFAPTSDDKSEVVVVPEPATLALFGLGLLSLVMTSARRYRDKR